MRITSRRGRIVSGLALVGTGALVLAGCAAAPEEEPTDTPAPGESSAEAIDFLPCMVSDFGGFDDKSFNQLGYEGLTEASEALGVTPQTVESTSESDYAPALDTLVAGGCDLIITVGFALSAATVDAALANPEVEFAILDDAADNDFDGKTDAPNIKPILFDTAQAAFLAGYASAGYSEAGKIGTFAGATYPTVLIFADGYSQGIEYYNEENGTDVELVGYDPADPESALATGEFVANEVARSTAQGLIDQGVDMILPVGGPIFQSAGAAIEDSGDDIALLGVDADLFDTFPTYSDLYFTSILKNMAPAVSEVVTAAANDEFDVAPYLGTLENGGVGIAPFHEFEDDIDPELVATLDELTAQIISGDIVVTSYLSPAE